MRTSFHHQPEAQHPKSPAIETPAGRLPHLRVISGQIIAGSNPNLSAVTPIADIRRCIGPTGSIDLTEMLAASARLRTGAATVAAAPPNASLADRR